MKVINLGEADSVLNNIIAQMRDKTVQKDSLRFRYNLERLGHIFAYELSKALDYSPKDVITPLATARVLIHITEVILYTFRRIENRIPDFPSAHDHCHGTQVEQPLRRRDVPFDVPFREHIRRIKCPSHDTDLADLAGDQIHPVQRRDLIGA